MTLTSIVYDTRRHGYFIRMQDSTGMTIELNRKFATQQEAEAKLNSMLDEVGAGRGEDIPVRRQ